MAACVDFGMARPAVARFAVGIARADRETKKKKKEKRPIRLIAASKMPSVRGGPSRKNSIDGRTVGWRELTQLLLHC